VQNSIDRVQNNIFDKINTNGGENIKNQSKAPKSKNGPYCHQISQDK
jgi:hypothetical protein